jgi:hypothetical protein
VYAAEILGRGSFGKAATSLGYAAQKLPKSAEIRQLGAVAEAISAAVRDIRRYDGGP